MHGCGSIRWSMVHLPGTTTLKKAEFTSSSSHKLSRAPQPGVGVHETLPYHVVECWLAWSCSGIMQATTAAVVSRAQWPFDAQETPLLSSPLQFLALNNLSASSPVTFPKPCGRGCDTDVLRYGGILHRYLFSERQPHVSFCVNHCLLPKDTSLWGPQALLI